MQTIIDDKYPVHFVNAWTKNLALCGSGWLQATGSEELVTCPDCKRLLTQPAPDAGDSASFLNLFYPIFNLLNKARRNPPQRR